MMKKDSIFDYLEWINPKNIAFSEEETFFNEHAHLFTSKLSIYNDLSSTFSLIKACIVLESLDNKNKVDKFVNYYREEDLKKEEIQKIIFYHLPYFEFNDQKIYMINYSPYINKIYRNYTYRLKSFPFSALLEDKNIALDNFFDHYGYLPFSSIMTRLIPLKYGDKFTKTFYHPHFSTIYVIDNQGLLEREIPLFDDKIKNIDYSHLFDRLNLLMKDYYNLDEKSFLDHLLSLHFISESLYEELKNIYLHKLKKKEKRLR